MNEGFADMTLDPSSNDRSKLVSMPLLRKNQSVFTPELPARERLITRDQMHKSNDMMSRL